MSNINLVRGFGLVLLGSAPGACGSDVGGGDTGREAAPEVIQRANLRYDSYTALAQRGGYTVTPDLLAATQLDRTAPDLEDGIIDDLEAPERVIPYVMGLGFEGDSWLQTQLVPVDQLLETGENLQEYSRILGRSAGLEYEEVWALDMSLEVDGEVIEYTAYAFVDDDEDEVDIIDPVALGLNFVPEYVPRHAIVGQSGHDTWLGCKPAHEQAMPQGEMEHWDWWCWDKASCADEAVGKIFCDANAEGCPRIHGTTVQSGSCTNTAGGGFLCTGPEASSVNSKETTIANGNCQDNINVELWWGPSDGGLNWEITAEAGPIGVKFSGTTPTHSVYQVYKLTMCCSGAVAEEEEPVDPTSGSDDGGGDGADPAPID